MGSKGEEREGKTSTRGSSQRNDTDQHKCTQLYGCMDGIYTAPLLIPVSSILPHSMSSSPILSHSILFDSQYIPTLRSTPLHSIPFHPTPLHPIPSHPISTCCVLGVLYCPCRGRGVRGILNSCWLLRKERVHRVSLPNDVQYVHNLSKVTSSKCM